eukprot:CAMPEP_0177191478 /NCGR_PEP_ID=MMETSP0367-20130122/21376_1 /TAXON_ID=447022 ORGANISM="Scrippsiella hangoei-like, Strain SHHI-4" /NCGR_SAMPLE_ID=MMETSP0367 /ASSEMBLY_ACC=CAM_ASM_000362 /LENGTH=141 /DNA_ID=CAMNT_0018639191 /DNA_START=529 /DNA_END=951 /DNA_ORIENTATION=+
MTPSSTLRHLRQLDTPPTQCLNLDRRPRKPHQHQLDALAGRRHDALAEASAGVQHAVLALEDEPDGVRAGVAELRARLGDDLSQGGVEGGSLLLEQHFATDGPHHEGRLVDPCLGPLLSLRGFVTCGAPPPPLAQAAGAAA